MPSLGPNTTGRVFFFFRGVGGWVFSFWDGLFLFFFSGGEKKRTKQPAMKCKSVLKLKHEVAAETLNLLWAKFEENLIRMTRRSSLGLVKY